MFNMASHRAITISERKVASKNSVSKAEPFGGNTGKGKEGERVADGPVVARKRL